jgi:membrane-associated phospholipid phosphatase
MQNNANQNSHEATEKKVKTFSLELVIVLALFALVLFFFGLITDEIVLEDKRSFDDAIFKMVEPLRSAGLTNFMKLVTFFGSQMFLLPAYIGIAVYILAFQRKTARSLGVSAVAISGAGIVFIFKNIFRRPRPLAPLVDDIASFSYPSGHSFSAFTFAGIIIYLIYLSKMKVWVKWLLSILLFLFAALIALTRVYLNVHFPSDILAGFLLSMLWLSISFYAIKRMKFFKEM